MSINNSALKMFGVTKDEYERWCRRYRKIPYRKYSQSTFFRLMLEGKILRDEEGELMVRKGCEREV